MLRAKIPSTASQGKLRQGEATEEGWKASETELQPGNRQRVVGQGAQRGRMHLSLDGGGLDGPCAPKNLVQGLLLSDQQRLCTKPSTAHSSAHHRQLHTQQHLCSRTELTAFQIPARSSVTIIAHSSDEGQGTECVCNVSGWQS